MNKFIIAILGCVLFFGCSSDEKSKKDTLNLEINGTKKGVAVGKAEPNSQKSQPKIEANLDDKKDENLAKNSPNLSENSQKPAPNFENLKTEDINKTIDEIA
ncbi:MAG: hypothetical protein IJT33_03110, partial [Campylobacter sp.]|nr:hypothetical protein [Campylobacter sp.]